MTTRIPDRPDRTTTDSWLHPTTGKRPESSNNAESGPNQLRNFGLALADELLRVAPSAMPYAECEGHVFRFAALVESGDLRGADAALAAARSAARLPYAHWTVIQWEAVRALLGGELADAEALSTRG